MFSLRPTKEVFQLSVLANFAEVFLAKEGHSGPVGINLLHKIQLPNMSSLYGAMLAGVDYVVMGAGIPRDIPSILDRLSRHDPVEMKIPVEGEEMHKVHFDPQHVFKDLALPTLKRPQFLAIISAVALAMTLARKCEGRVDGFVVEGAPAGGHNAPPRGPLHLNTRGEPVYGPRDDADLAGIRALGLPFWLAGGYSDPERLKEALAQGAAGVQVGTAFAFCEESGMADAVKRDIIAMARRGEVDIFTDPTASPTKFPFKVVRLKGSMSEPEVYAKRSRVCDLGYLRTAYRRPAGGIGYRCAAELPANFVRKGGHQEETVGRKCLCNGLLSAIGLAQIQSDLTVEAPLITSGEDLKTLSRFLKGDSPSYTAKDVLDHILGKTAAELPA